MGISLGVIQIIRHFEIAKVSCEHFFNITLLIYNKIIQFYRSSEYEVCKLSISKEDDKKHDRESSYIAGALEMWNK